MVRPSAGMEYSMTTVREYGISGFIPKVQFCAVTSKGSPLYTVVGFGVPVHTIFSRVLFIRTEFMVSWEPTPFTKSPVKLPLVFSPTVARSGFTFENPVEVVGMDDPIFRIPKVHKAAATIRITTMAQPYDARYSAALSAFRDVSMIYIKRIYKKPH